MSAPNREQLANNASSQLNGAINNSVTSITVVNGSSFPSVGNFRIICEDEIMLCTARSGNNLTVVRGQEGTSAASHADGSNVTHVFTADAMFRWAADNISGYRNNSPPLGVISNGSGGILTASDFTWVNQGSASVADENGTIKLIIPPGAGENCRILKRTAPSTPYSVVAAIQTFSIREGTFNCGLVFRKNSDGKLHAFGYSQDDFGPMRWTIYNFSSPTSFSSTPYGREDCLHLGECLWLKMEDDNTNLKFSVSYDGVEWVQIHSLGRTSFMTGGPDEIGFYANNPGSSSHNAMLRICHWSTF
jgi:hypothetical protein